MRWVQSAPGARMPTKPSRLLSCRARYAACDTVDCVRTSACCGGQVLSQHGPHASVCAVDLLSPDSEHSGPGTPITDDCLYAGCQNSCTRRWSCMQSSRLCWRGMGVRSHLLEGSLQLRELRLCLCQLLLCLLQLGFLGLQHST